MRPAFSFDPYAVLEQLRAGADPHSTLPTVPTPSTARTKTVGSVGTVGGGAARECRPDLTAFDERAAILEHDAGMPRAEAERRAATEAGFVSAADLYSALCRTWAARLASMKADEESTAGNKMLATALTFLRVGWGEKCLALGWREEDLFCLHPGAPWVRYDCMGRAYLAKQPVAVTADGIALRSGLRLRRYPSGDQGVLPWEDSRDDQDAGGGHG